MEKYISVGLDLSLIKEFLSQSCKENWNLVSFPGLTVSSGPKMILEKCLPLTCMEKNGIAQWGTVRPRQIVVSLTFVIWPYFFNFHTLGLGPDLAFRNKGPRY